jgi:Uri superfamily endonuclease
MSMAKGVYILVVSVSKDINVNVGALGSVNFEKGLYAYVGSAQNNLEKRIERHLRKTKQKFWHIDYLLDNANVEVLKVFHKKAGRLEECKIAKNISEIGVPVKGFGSSDCKCKSHLFKLKGYQFLREFMLETILPIW